MIGAIIALAAIVVALCIHVRDLTRQVNDVRVRMAVDDKRNREWVSSLQAQIKRLQQ